MIEKRGNWQRLSTRIVHKNPFYQVREDTVIKPNGAEGFYNVIEGRDAVFVVAVDEAQNVYLVELYRYTNDNVSIEVPAGGIDGQDPLAAAKRELQEETGLRAKSWRALGYVHPTNGIINGKNHIFLAQGLEQTMQNDQAEEGITKVTKIPLKDALLMVKNGQITDSESITPLTMAALELGLLRVV
ncbi:MAG TPA: NUDIX hydrolase [Candidatus Saccharimonadales bacterium]|nr:NUDIX hydrolase [Candidatus Saccharimonadales bacterium]